MPTTEQHTTTVLLVDDHPLMRRGLCTLLESEANITVTGEAAPEDSTAAEPILQTKLHRPSSPANLVLRTRVLERLEAG